MICTVLFSLKIKPRRGVRRGVGGSCARGSSRAQGSEGRGCRCVGGAIEHSPHLRGQHDRWQGGAAALCEHPRNFVESYTCCLERSVVDGSEGVLENNPIGACANPFLAASLPDAPQCGEDVSAQGRTAVAERVGTAGELEFLQQINEVLFGRVRRGDRHGSWCPGKGSTHNLANHAPMSQN